MKFKSVILIICVMTTALLSNLPLGATEENTFYFDPYFASERIIQRITTDAADNNMAAVLHSITNLNIAKQDYGIYEERLEAYIALHREKLEAEGSPERLARFYARAENLRLRYTQQYQPIRPYLEILATALNNAQGDRDLIINALQSYQLKGRTIQNNNLK